MFSQFKKWTGTTVKSIQTVGASSTGEHSSTRDSAVKGGSKQKPTTYPSVVGVVRGIQVIVR
jgi:hypothetical protein